MAESRRITYYLGLADKLESEQNLSDEELSSVLLCDYPDFDRYLTEKARAVRERIYGKDVLLPATTALGTIDSLGREKGISAGANVVMPNLSPVSVRGKYLLYDNKICTGDEAAECIRCMTLRVSHTGYQVVESRGDHIRYRKETENG